MLKVRFSEGSDIIVPEKEGIKIYHQIIDSQFLDLFMPSNKSYKIVDENDKADICIVGTQHTNNDLLRDDEVNIFSSLLAKDLGCKRTMAIVNNSNYRNLSKKLDLDVLINPGNITTSAILQYVRRGKVKEIHDFGNERGEIMEIEILPTTKFADKKISDLDMPEGEIGRAHV